jgi:beta-lactamase regulating signal transducer with metallopeptidase domain
MNTLFEAAASAEFLNLWVVTAAKGLAILALVTLICVALRNASSSLRHLCWGLGMMAVLILPALSILLPQWNVALIDEPILARSQSNETVDEFGVGEIAADEPWAVVDSESWPLAAGESWPLVGGESAPQAVGQNGEAGAAGDASDAPAALAPLAAGPSAQITQNGPASSSSWASPGAAIAGSPWYASMSAFEWMLAVWILGAVLLLVHMLACSIIVQRLVSRARPVTDRDWMDLLEEMSDRLMIRRPVQLLQTGRISVPLVWGAVRPVVLLPEAAGEWTEERRRCVLAHELAHVRRWDTLTQTAAHVACVVHWYNPLAWRAAHSMRLEREKACDDLVLQTSRARPSEYASHLLDLARHVPGSLSIPSGALAMARPSQLEGRVLSILDERKRRTLARPSVAVTVLLMMLLLVPIAAMSPFHAEGEDARESEIVEVKESDRISVDGIRTHIEKAARAAAGEIAARAYAVADEKLNAKTSSISSGPQDDIERTFSVAGGGWLMIDTDHGNIDVESGTEGQVHVTVRRTPRGNAEASDFEVSFEQVGDKVTIMGDNTIRNSGRNSVSVSYVVRVPHRFNVDLETSGGNISLDDLDGRAKLNTAGGNLSIGRVTGEVDANTSGGNISVDGSNANVAVNTSGGNIHLGRIGGTVKATTSGGNISVEEVNGDLTAKTSGGQISARLATQPQGRSVLKTSGGGITVYLADGIAVDLEAETSAGRVRSDVEVTTSGEIKKDRLRGTINGGGPVLELDTSAGDIHIRKL